MFRIGFGFDTHKLSPDVPFFLGGILIPHSKGATGHSDGDTLIHAIIDALLGAAGFSDIGTQYPDTDDAFKGIDSKLLLQRTQSLVTSAGYQIGNIDTTIVLQVPKLQNMIPLMRECLANCLDIPVDRISVKAKTSEKLGFIGREEGVSAYAVVLLNKISPV